MKNKIKSGTITEEPFGPPPIEYCYRCEACGESYQINEAIIDVEWMWDEIEGKEVNRMPTLECYSCNQRTLKYVED